MIRRGPLHASVQKRGGIILDIADQRKNDAPGLLDAVFDP
jgi:hypothetical protein